MLTSLVALSLAIEHYLQIVPVSELQGHRGHQQALPEYESAITVIDTALTLLVR